MRTHAQESREYSGCVYTPQLQDVTVLDGGNFHCALILVVVPLWRGGGQLSAVVLLPLLCAYARALSSLSLTLCLFNSQVLCDIYLYGIYTADKPAAYNIKLRGNDANLEFKYAYIKAISRQAHASK